MAQQGYDYGKTYGLSGSARSNNTSPDYIGQGEIFVMARVLGRELKGRICHNRPDLTEDDACALARIIERLIEAYEPERIYLFGSKARGGHGPDSDFHLLVDVSDSAAPPDRRHSLLAYEVLRGKGTAADVLAWSHSAFESRLHLAASLPATVMREGKLLHAA
jgi:predicted nucleotidyltransferase